MPELPEVENIKNHLKNTIIKKRIIDLYISKYKLRRGPDTGYIKDGVIDSITRRGKYIILGIQERFSQLIHLGMSGRILYFNDASQYLVNKHDHVILYFSDNSCIVFNDPRRFGVWDVICNTDEDPALCKLGPEPFDSAFNAEYLQQCFRKRSLSIKQIIMNSHIVVGIGNIYASEILFRAQIHPLRPANLVTFDELQRIIYYTREVLTLAIAKGGSTLRDYKKIDGSSGNFQETFAVYGLDQKLCLHQHNYIMKCIVNGRSTFFCPTCQQ